MGFSYTATIQPNLADVRGDGKRKYAAFLAIIVVLGGRESFYSTVKTFYNTGKTSTMLGKSFPLPANMPPAIAAVAVMFALRMFGVFVMLPVLAVYAAGLAGAAPWSVGLAFGVYGLTQAICQILFGAAADRYGRKPVITLGLLIFAAGGLWAAAADSIVELIIARGVQGGGAVSAATLALTADLTRPDQRTKAMALIGMTIGAMFLLALMTAPPLHNAMGARGLFALSAGLAMVAVGVLWLCIPTPAAPLPAGRLTANMRALLRDANLLRLNFGVFFLHLILTALFVALPNYLHAVSGLPLAQHWKIYAPVLILSVAGIPPLVIFESRLRGRALQLAVGLLCVAALGLATAGDSLAPWLVALWLFFVAFNALEGLLPSLVSRAANPAHKGAALGLFHTFQFIGMFVGGLAAGFSGGAAGVFWLCAAAALLWLATAARKC